jgi:phosphatidylglycerophosphatase C
MSPKRLAVFDLDGTITRHDTLVRYVLGYLLRRPWRLPRALLVVPAAAAFGLRLIGHGELKSALLRATLGGVSRAEIERWTAQFVPRLLANGTFAAAREAIGKHISEGDHLVLLSATIDLYVPAIARALGFHEAICTGVRWRGDRLDGHLSTPNRRGEEKARCLRELRKRHCGHAAAYGNAASDLAHLKLVEHGVLVNGSAWARRAAARAGIACTVWR